eukprot:Gb_39125 [translate_table: standard]
MTLTTSKPCSNLWLYSKFSKIFNFSNSSSLSSPLSFFNLNGSKLYGDNILLIIRFSDCSFSSLFSELSSVPSFRKYPLPILPSISSKTADPFPDIAFLSFSPGLDTELVKFALALDPKFANFALLSSELVQAKCSPLSISSKITDLFSQIAFATVLDRKPDKFEPFSCKLVQPN